MIQFLFGLIAFFSWGSEAIFDKKCLEKLNPFNALSARYFFVCILVVLTALVFTEIRFPSIQLIPYILFTCFVGSAAIIFFFKALNESSVSLAIAIAKNYFLVTVILSIIFFHEAISLTQIIAVLLILCSVFLLSFDRKEKGFKLGKELFFLYWLNRLGNIFCLISQL